MAWRGHTFDAKSKDQKQALGDIKPECPESNCPFSLFSIILEMTQTNFRWIFLIYLKKLTLVWERKLHFLFNAKLLLYKKVHNLNITGPIYVK
jgi:hypothetical protein